MALISPQVVGTFANHMVPSRIVKQLDSLYEQVPLTTPAKRRLFPHGSMRERVAGSNGAGQNALRDWAF